MAKAKKRSDKEAPNTFHSSLASPVKSNPKNKMVSITKIMEMLKIIQNKIAQIVPDYEKYVVIQVSPIGSGQLFYNINRSCPKDKFDDIESVIHENAASLSLKVVTEIE